MAAGAVLDLHEGLSPQQAPEQGKSRCENWPENAWLISDRAHQVRGRCKATNLCDYCAVLGAVENTEMLALDALEGAAPQLWTVLTTRTATLDMARFYKAREYVVRALRDRFGPAVEYASLLEYTTGYGPRSGGKRRPHWNLLWKGITPDDQAEADAIIFATWCDHVDAEPQSQRTTVVRDVGLMRYLALHFQKESQRPPRGFRGQRFNCSRGYFGDRSRSEMRALARESLRAKRALHRAREQGYEGQEAEDVAAADLALQADTVWAIYFEPEEVPEWDEDDLTPQTTGSSSSGTATPRASATGPGATPSALFDGSTLTSTPATVGATEWDRLTEMAAGGWSAAGSARPSASWEVTHEPQVEAVAWRPAEHDPAQVAAGQPPGPDPARPAEP